MWSISGTAKANRTGWLLTGLAMIWVMGAGGAEPEGLETLRAERARLRDRPRRIIFNNDGCDAMYFPADREVTPENLLALRTTNLLGTQVDTLVYCTISSGFGFFTHRTEVGDILDREWDSHRERNQVNATRPLLDQGTDPLRIMVDFARENDWELFWSMRMNDTHDASHTPENPYPLFSPIKERHPEFLMGSREERPPHGVWSAVDYTHPEIRELAFRFIEEVCQNYDVDGIELDFFRHLHYFRGVSWGGEASAEEREMMTDLVRRIRLMTEQEGLRRGRPILVSIRVPDSPEYARTMGLDYESWLAEGLVDLVVGAGYFQCNPWEDLVALGRRHGVPVYPSLDESRVRGEDRAFRRQSIEGYRGRALRAWQAGVDGIYLFNQFNPNSAHWRELGNPDELQTMDKLYFATIRHATRGYGRPSFWLAGGERFQTLPTLTPEDTSLLLTDRPFEITLFVGDNPSATPHSAGINARCRLWVPGLEEAGELRVIFNDLELTDGVLEGEWLVLPVPPENIRSGGNRISITWRERGAGLFRDATLKDLVLSIVFPDRE